MNSSSLLSNHWLYPPLGFFGRCLTPRLSISAHTAGNCGTRSSRSESILSVALCDQAASQIYSASHSWASLPPARDYCVELSFNARFDSDRLAAAAAETLLYLCAHKSSSTLVEDQSDHLRHILPDILSVSCVVIPSVIRASFTLTGPFLP